ncbi:hypothetical protein [Neolewinella antarctica]|uniref:CHAT domain-containing protein n=1 Tax=Neolewinella antarctica TaxID=442734 RepID=A0ABX0XGH2_9BACT|nr:hypothetical protein [Neolewinella antarctica]NJC28009.1 hypothetical protein [Neolewinella antarctica]
MDTQNILYISITYKNPEVNYWQVPDDLSRFQPLNFIRLSPKNLRQFEDIDNYNKEQLSKLNSIHEVVFLNYKSFQNQFAEIRNHDAYKIIVILADVCSKETLDSIKKNDNENGNTYLYLYNSTNEESKIDIEVKNFVVVKSPYDFVDKLIGKDIIKPKLNEAKNSFVAFGPVRALFSVCNQATLNYWTNDHETVSYEDAVKISRDVLTGSNEISREDLIIQKLQEYHKIRSEIVHNSGIDDPSNKDTIPSLVLAYPYHSPVVKEQMKRIKVAIHKKFGVSDRQFTRFLQAEQDERYITHLAIPDNKEDIQDLSDLGINSARMIQERIVFTDFAIYLHSAVSFSAAIRLPIIGQSINRELGFVRPSVFGRLSNDKNRRRLNKTITKIGKKIGRDRITNKVSNRIDNWKGQITAVSDLPIEWMICRETILSFSHDVCRIPESPLSSLVSQYNSQFEQLFLTPDNLDYNNILVVYGSTEDKFKVWQNEVDKIANKTGLNTCSPNSIKELVNSVNEINPTLLVFDCHGGIGDDNFSTYLSIGKENLTNEDIVKHNISAPIVFLSACGTAPNFGLIDSIAQGFFQAGSKSVTSTFLPIDINLGSITYINMLIRLQASVHDGAYVNWLEFIADIGRKTYIESIVAEMLHSNNGAKGSIDNLHTEWLSQLSTIDLRKRLFKFLYTTDNKMIKNAVSKVVPEYLFYTHMGRADLIIFASSLHQRDLVGKNVYVK